jgi:polygalacturonase
LLDGVRIYNRVNLNNDGFHINSSEYVHIINCDITCQDDACALFGSNKFVTITNCTFSTRWSIFRFGGGHAENITITNCVIYDTYGCPIKMRCGAGSLFENITFSNLIMKNVTGPITIGLDSKRRNANQNPAPNGIVRNIVFNGIRGFVLAEGKQHSDLPWPQKFRPGETRHCIVVNGANDDVLENISFQDIHFTYEGGGTADESVREVPQLAGEYFEIGTPPAFGMYARNVRGLTLQNVRFEVVKKDLRPAVVFENVNDAAINSLSIQGNNDAEALLRFTESRDVLVTGMRVLTPAAVLLKLIGSKTSGITIEGGDLTKVAKALVLSGGALAKNVTLRR